jgi:hypothetical protein
MGISIISWQRDDPMQFHQLAVDERRPQDVLRKVLQEHVARGARVEPDYVTAELERRYEVSDHDGWLATYWLSDQAAAQLDSVRALNEQRHHR